MFDPYHRWLGIPPEGQPANHYRLLGIKLFEASPDVIETAADRQMGHLRTFQTGPNGAVSQKLLNEVAGAKLCLLNPAKKAAYDAALWQSLAPEPALPFADRDVAPPEVEIRLRPRLAGAGRGFPVAGAAVGGLLIVAAIGFAALWTAVRSSVQPARQVAPHAGPGSAAQKKPPPAPAPLTTRAPRAASEKPKPQPPPVVPPPVAKPSPPPEKPRPTSSWGSGRAW